MTTGGPPLWVSPYASKQPERSPFERGLFPCCGFRMFLRPLRPVDDAALLTALGLRGHPLDPLRALPFVVTITNLGPWIHIADDYGLWNEPTPRKAAIRALARLGELFTFLLPDPNMEYRFAHYVNRARVRLRVVDSPRYDDQILRIDTGARLPGEPEQWEGEPFPMMVSIAQGLGIEDDPAIFERPYAWRWRPGGCATRALALW